METTSPSYQAVWCFGWCGRKTKKGRRRVRRGERRKGREEMLMKNRWKKMRKMRRELKERPGRAGEPASSALHQLAVTAVFLQPLQSSHQWPLRHIARDCLISAS